MRGSERNKTLDLYLLKKVTKKRKVHRVATQLSIVSHGEAVFDDGATIAFCIGI
jgi:hypothetical protein